MECVVCASEIPVTSKVCPYCGHVVKQAEAEEKSEAPVLFDSVPLYTPREKTCKYCGSPIDAETGICTHCDRAYNKSRASLILLYVVSFLLVFSVIIGCIGWINYKSVKENTYWLDKYTELQKRVQELPTQGLVEFYEEKLDFYETNIVVITSVSEQYYHIYGCEDCKSPFEWAGYVGSAEEGGFKPCPKCTE